jgi:hypothetical protein
VVSSPADDYDDVTSIPAILITSIKGYKQSIHDLPSEYLKYDSHDMFPFNKLRDLELYVPNIKNIIYCGKA